MIRIGREIQCLPYAGFLKYSSFNPWFTTWAVSFIYSNLRCSLVLALLSHLREQFG